MNSVYWVCGACGVENSSSRMICSMCGAGKAIPKAKSAAIKEDSNICHRIFIPNGPIVLPWEQSFKVYTPLGGLEEGIVKAFIRTFFLPKEIYKKGYLITEEGQEWIIYANQELRNWYYHEEEAPKVIASYRVTKTEPQQSVCLKLSTKN